MNLCICKKWQESEKKITIIIITKYNDANATAKHITFLIINVPLLCKSKHYS